MKYDKGHNFFHHFFFSEVAVTFTRHELELSVYMSYIIKERQSHAAIERHKVYK